MTHCVVYRTGGTEKFTWHRSIAMTADTAIQAQRDMAHMGYRSHIELYKRSLSPAAVFNTALPAPCSGAGDAATSTRTHE
mgnify:CR=1 FL=1